MAFASAALIKPVVELISSVVIQRYPKSRLERKLFRLAWIIPLHNNDNSASTRPERVNFAKTAKICSSPIAHNWRSD